MIVPTLLLLLCADSGALSTPAPTSTATPLALREAPRQIGQGFAKRTPSVEVKLTRAFGITETGSQQSHNLWLAQIQGGLMLTDTLAEDRWFGGNVEGIALLMAGGQDRPESAYFVGLNGGLRYHFRTGTRITPFVGGSIGVAATDVGEPDLGGKFQFNEQFGAGVRYFVNPNNAITLEYAYWHVSNGSIRQPNDGINAHLVTLGFAWLF